MRNFTSSMLDQVGFSGIRAIFEKANQLEAAGKKMVHLEIGRLDFDTPLHIKEAAKEALDQGLVHYAPNLGLPVFRQAVSAAIQRQTGLEYSDKEIIATIGATQGAFLAMAAFLEKGDEVIIPTPTFVSYVNAPRFFDAKPVSLLLKPEDDFQINPAALEAAITPKTKMLVLISPHNPTGSVLKLKTLEAIAELAQKYDFLVLSDEVYDQMLYDGEKHISIATLPGMRERTIMLNSFSKTFSMTGWRLGYLAADAPLINPLIRVHQYSVGSACSFVQAAGAVALNSPLTCVQEMAAELTKRRAFLLENLHPALVPVIPKGAFYFFLDVLQAGLKAEEAVDLLLEEGVSSVPGPAFGPGGEGYVRIAYATNLEELRFAAEAINRVFLK